MRERLSSGRKFWVSDRSIRSNKVPPNKHLGGAWCQHCLSTMHRNDRIDDLFRRNIFGEEAFNTDV